MAIPSFTFIVLMLVSTVNGLLKDSKVDVHCNKQGMNTRLTFKETFRGIVFSKGYHEDPLCRYVEGKTGLNAAAFNIPFTDCGTTMMQNSFNMTNVVVIQHNPLIETWRDIELVLSCEHTFPALETKMLDKFVQSPLSKPAFMAWLELKLDNDSFLQQSTVYVGDKVTANIYFKDSGNFNDVMVKNCKARDSFDANSETKTIDLLDEFGCPTSENLLEAFNISAITDGKFVASAQLSAFRFTDKDYIFLTCDIEFCPEICLDFCRSDRLMLKHKSHVTKILKKRSLDINPRNGQYSDESTLHLMHKTMNVLTNGLRLRRKFLQKIGDADLQAAEDTIDVGEKAKGTEMLLTAVTEFEFLEDEVSPPPNFRLTVTKKLEVQTLKTQAIFRPSNPDLSNCFPKVRFTVLTTLLSLIILCLLLTNIFMALYIRSEKKRREISNYLLYCYK